MNARDKNAIKKEAKRFMSGVVVTEAEFNTLRISLPLLNAKQELIHFFAGRRPKSKKLSLLVPVESVGILAVNSTLARLQPLLKTYGLILTQNAVIVEENHKFPLSNRIGRISQALIGIDCIVRLWNIEYRRDPNAFEGKDSKSPSDTADNRPSW